MFTECSLNCNRFIQKLAQQKQERRAHAEAMRSQSQTTRERPANKVLPRCRVSVPNDASEAFPPFSSATELPSVKHVAQPDSGSVTVQ